MSWWRVVVVVWCRYGMKEEDEESFEEKNKRDKREGRKRSEGGSSKWSRRGYKNISHTRRINLNEVM